MISGVLSSGLAGCAATLGEHAARDRELVDAARALLEMHPEANWTACYNRLLELGPASMQYLATRPVMQRTAAPDDLQVMLHCSLMRLLANRRSAPRLSVNCFETTLDVLHFDPKVRGRSLGVVCLPTKRLPEAWHALYAFDFDHGLAAEIGVERDRQAMLGWWRSRRGEPTKMLAQRRLEPRVEHLWVILSRRYADVWLYELSPEPVLCSYPPTGAALFHGKSWDYNLVRAACIWLGTWQLADVQGKLIECVGHRSSVVAYNARFALERSRDPRIREVIERYKEPTRPVVPTPDRSVAAGW